MKIILVIGARPNFMKIAPILEALQRHNESGELPGIEAMLVHTGQHYDRVMSQLFFEDLGMPRPDINLGVGSGTHAQQTGRVMIAFEQVLQQEQPDIVVVVGDINSTMACTIAAKKLDIAVAHVEAGLRSRDMTMPEEINRKVTDSISDYLFTSEPEANANLKAEGIFENRIFFVGNVMIDTLLKHRERAAASPILDKLGLKEGQRTNPYGVVTLHRPSNVDNPEVFREVCDALHAISDRLPLIFPCHPRTQERILDFGIGSFLEGSDSKATGIMLIPPLGYLDFLWLNANARVILTDSGGVQEEATILGIPCLTIRENTERPITVTQGTNQVVGTSKKMILRGFDSAIQNLKRQSGGPDKWDGRAAERIVEILAQMGKTEYAPLRAKISTPVVSGNTVHCPVTK